MTKFSRENSFIDILPLIGLLLIGAAVYLTWGLAATLAYAGAALIVVAVVLARCRWGGLNECDACADGAGGAKRFHPSQDMDWTAVFGGQAAIAGMPSPSIGESLALPSVFACIRVLGETVAGLPLITYRETRNGGRERAPIIRSTVCCAGRPIRR